MKQVIFFRHAKADRGPQYPTDHARDLTKRGIRDARRMGRFLASAGFVPDSVVSSSAARARRTLELAAEAGEWGSTIRLTDALYDAPVPTIVDEIRDEPGATATLMLVGHEPSWSECVEHLIGGGSIRLATGAAACIEFEFDDWRMIGRSTGNLVWIVVPGLLA